MENWKLIVSFLSGGLAGAIFKHFVDKQKNKIQKLECRYLEDEVISKLPIAYEDTTHNNLHSKKFEIVNTTNIDIAEIKIVFSFESESVVAKWTTYSKAGNNIPKGRIYTRKNECQFIIKNFNRKEKVEVYLEIGNVNQDKFNITELNITGIKAKYVDLRKNTTKKTVRMVERRELNAGS
ncbi:hypothetical protein [Tenacibaculum insulae]|jgi:hypothetical protein|uniref:hypothetical protein n=1 Tax=Tenacibaculum insulae TaxID=2029677 RepID=UPI003AB4BC88